MTTFEPFDPEYEIDKTVLSDKIESYMRPSIERWLHSMLLNHSLLLGRAGQFFLREDGFLHPIQETFRQQFPNREDIFMLAMFGDIGLFRNLLTYILQNTATVKEGQELETILERCSSAYAVEFLRGKEIQGIKHSDGSPAYEIIGMKLVHRVAPIVKTQAVDTFQVEPLLAEAWAAYYDMKPDDEKVVTRATDALSGAIRDKYFPTEKRPVFGTLLAKLRSDPSKYPLPANTIYDQQQFLDTMKDFSKIRGNHKKGTGRAPTHEEAGFVLHFAVMFYQLLRSNP